MSTAPFGQEPWAAFVCVVAQPSIPSSIGASSSLSSYASIVAHVPLVAAIRLLSKFGAKSSGGNTFCCKYRCVLSFLNCLRFWLTVIFRSSAAHVSRRLWSRRDNVETRLVYSSFRPGAVGGFPLHCCATFDSVKHWCARSKLIGGLYHNSLPTSARLRMKALVGEERCKYVLQISVRPRFFRRFTV